MVTFPDNPAVNEIFTANARVWIWTGYAWKQSVQSLRGIAPATQPGREVQTLTAAVDYQPPFTTKTSYI